MGGHLELKISSPWLAIQHPNATFKKNYKIKLELFEYDLYLQVEMTKIRN